MGAVGRLRHLRGSQLRQIRFASRAGFIGDPGFFSKLKKLSLKKVLKGVAPFVPLIGGPMGAVLQAATLPGGGPPGLPGIPAPSSINLGLPGVGMTFPLGPSSGRAGHALSMHGDVPRGFHISKKTGKVVKNRHMNPLNPRALRKSMSRVTSFARFAKRTIAFTHTHHLKAKGRKRR